MDLSYDPHAERARRKNRSSTHLEHLSLAPLTTKIPFNDDDDEPAIVDFPGRDRALLRSTSYLEGKSAPTTPRLLSRTPASPRSRSHHRTPSAHSTHVSKSKSTTQLPGVTTAKRRRGTGDRHAEHKDNDWVFRTGALMSTEAREFKGQSWLVSRQSSTSLAGMKNSDDDDDDEGDLERQLALERDAASRQASRRGSSARPDRETLSGRGSRFTSRANSVASHSHAGRGVMSPPEHAGAAGDSYFPRQDSGDESMRGPDFVNLDERLEQLGEDSTQDDEAAVRRLVRHGKNDGGSWMSSLVGWSLFSLDENDEDYSDGSDDESVEDTTPRVGRSGWSARHFEGVSNAPEEKLPPPRSDEGAWGDAAWLLSVATKVMF